jgi:hypothetical protein
VPLARGVISIHRLPRPSQGDAQLVGHVVEGVGSYLESAIGGVRLLGMRVGEAFAAVMGTDLRFEELNGLRCGGRGWPIRQRRIAGSLEVL